MARSHLHRMRIAFSDCDPAQIVFFANYFKWFDTSFAELMGACGVPSWRETAAHNGIIGAPLVDAQATFRNSATYGEDLEVESWVEHWGRKSFVVRQIVRRDETVLCMGREVRIFAVQDPDDPLRIKAVPIPEDIRALCS